MPEKATDDKELSELRAQLGAARLLAEEAEDDAGRALRLAAQAKEKVDSIERRLAGEAEV